MNTISFEIIRGTTPTITCRIPINIPLHEAQEIWFSISQAGVIIVDRKLSEDSLIINGQTLSITLTQEETLSFQTFFNAECGIRIRINDSSLATSVPAFARIVDVTKGGII